MKRKLSAFPAVALQHLGLVIAFALLVAAKDFTYGHPALAAILVFVFSLPYLAASLVTKRANFLYGTLLLGAVSYFLTCGALGSPDESFPLLSVPLVLALWLVGRKLQLCLPAERMAFPRTVFRAMNITAAVFAGWALMQVSGLIGEPGWLRYVAGLTFLGYAGIYLGYCVGGAPAVYAYAFSLCLVLGGAFTVAAAAPARFCWLAVLAATAIILLVGIGLHRARKYTWSRHLYFSAGGAIFLSLLFSLASWPFVLVDLALASLLLWWAYERLATTIEDVRSATLAERVIAKYFFLVGLGLTIPVAAMIFIFPGHPRVALAAVIAGLTFLWITWRRRSEVAPLANLYAPAAAMFVSAGLLGLSRQLPSWLAPMLAIVAPVAMLAALELLQRLFDAAKHPVCRRSVIVASVFPAFFAWFIPLVSDQPAVALVAAVIAAGTVAVLVIRGKQPLYGYAFGPALAGVLVAVIQLVPLSGDAAWIACTALAALAGAAAIEADARSKAVFRGAASLSWLILSFAAVAIAGGAAAPHLVYSVTAIGVIAALLAGSSSRREQKDVFDLLIFSVSALATMAAVVVGPFGDVGSAVAGACLLSLSAAHWAAWGFSRGAWSARAATTLLALGWLLVSVDVFDPADVRLASGAGVVLILFVFAAITRVRVPSASHSAVVTGHVTGIVLALATLVWAWSLTTSYLPLAAAPLVAMYFLIPKLRGNFGFRLGTLLWLSFVALFCLATFGQTEYWQQTPLILLAGISLIWLGAGFLLDRSSTKAWAMPFYVSAAIVAGVCGSVRLFAQVGVDASWSIFLITGIVFAVLFLIFRQDVLAYLTTLSLSLMVFDWIKASTTIFTQDVFRYLVIGAAVLAALFALPHLKRMVSRRGTLPVFSIYTRRGALLMGIVVVAIAFVILSLYTLKVTGHPKFCISCHNMGDYYGSWQHSAHEDVACIGCHYEPGVTNTLLGKVEGLVQVVKYVSHSYGAKPHAMISNEACMRGGCHAEMDHSQEMLLFRDTVRFRHDTHLAENPRGQELNCVSCHGQTVQGEHISVSETTCLTCHFYGRGEDAVAAGECSSCHRLPAQAVSFMGESFDHQAFLKDKTSVRCGHCHSQVTQGNGAISPTRCRSCHMKGQLRQMDDQAQMHLVHVSEGHFDCLQCHDEIKHGIRPHQQQLLAAGNCGACHEGERHSLQEKVYAGAAVADVEAMPDVMYAAGVACDGCHVTAEKGQGGLTSFTKKISGAKPCADCHGQKRYGTMLVEWQQDTKDRLGELQPALKELAKACQSSQGSGQELTEAKKLLASARRKLSCIVQDGSYGAHNYAYVSEVLDSAETEIERGRALLSKLASSIRPEPKR